MRTDSGAVTVDRPSSSSLKADDLIDSISALRTCRVFSRLTDDQLHPIAKSLRFRRFKRGAILFYEDDPCMAVYVIGSGKIKAVRASVHGKPQIVDILGAGELMGAVSVLSDRSCRVTAVTLADVDLFVVPKEHFKRLLLQYPEVVFEVIRAIDTRIDRVHRLLSSVTFEKVPQRIARFLLWLAREHGSRTEEGMHSGLLLSREELAEAVGTSEETAVRVLTKLRKAGIVCMRNRQVVIVEPHKLEEWAQ